LGCGDDTTHHEGGGDAATPPNTGGQTNTGGQAGAGGSTSTGGQAGAGGSTSTGGQAGAGGSTSTGGQAGAGGGGPTAGWLYTIDGDPHIYLDGGGSTGVWMGRGVNLDDLFLCGYNYGLWMDSPHDGEHALLGLIDAMMASWKPNFVRVSLGMNSYSPVVHWQAGSDYTTAMTNVIEHLGSYAGVFVLVSLRSDTTMVEPGGGECGQGDDAVCLPSNATDDVYRALVQSFHDKPYVLFGIANEPGGNGSSNSDIRARMEHAVSVIRAQEDALGSPHHLIAVQGNQWTSQIAFYAADPLSFDNVVYEYHAYPPIASEYTFSNIPVIIGEYGPSGSDTSFSLGFFADVEAKQIPNLAWSLSPYSNCAPDLVAVTHDASLTTTAWGDVVKAYLQAH